MRAPGERVPFEEGVVVRYAHRRTSRLPFADTVIAVEAAARTHGFSIVRSHDIQSALASKGFDIGPLVIVELGPDEEADALLSLLLPIRLNVYEEEGSVVVAALRPTLFREVFPEHDLEEASQRLESAVVCVLDEACP